MRVCVCVCVSAQRTTCSTTVSCRLAENGLTKYCHSLLPALSLSCRPSLNPLPRKLKPVNLELRSGHQFWAFKERFLPPFVAAPTF
uniref:Putative secreted protein n=1 Tax=Anopheles darlingi TaxID=43151 RepID=A0A2M4DKU6_ANODA